MTVPNHIGIIMDGNRRWAKAHNLKPWEGHDKGAEVLKEIIEACINLKVKQLTLYSFSTENFKRTLLEKKFMFEIVKRECKSIIAGDSKVEKNKVRMNFAGNLSLFPKDLQKLMQEVMEKTKHHNNLIVNFAMGYGGRAEIVNAVNRIIKEGKEEITEESFKGYLYIKDDPELIIRTGGAQRLSNFLPYQSVYSELIFTETFWPDFKEEELKKCIEEFESRQRRFGK